MKMARSNSLSVFMEANVNNPLPFGSRTLTDALHKISKNYVDWCVSQQVKHVVVGKVEGVQRHTCMRKKTNKKKRNRNVNQKLSQWQFGKLSEYLAYKLAVKGITMEKVDESYTTSEQDQKPPLPRGNTSKWRECSCIIQT